MKKCIFIFYSLAILLFSSCEKKETYHFVIHGEVVHAYTGEPLAGIFVGASLKSWMSSCSGYLDKTYTDQNGYFTLDFEYTLRGEFNDEIVLGANSPNTFDSTLSEFKYISVETPVLSESEACEEQIIKVFPTGQIKMFVSDSIWQVINADSVEIQSLYETQRVYKNQSDDYCVYFHVEPSAVNLFKWSYYKDGIQSLEISNSIFVPNALSSYWSFYGPFKYEILF